MEKTISGSALEVLKGGLKGDAYAPGDEGYDEACAAWNLNAHQHPALVVVAEGAADVLAAVRLARDEGLGIGVMATGHGVAAPCDGGVLINTSRMKGVHVDPETSAARVEAGAKWADLVPEAAAHGLAGLQGSTSQVGIVGYTMGGGFGWLGRKYGFAADSVKEADVVTAEGELVKANAHENADLFWALKGGGGNFGIVTSLEFALYPITHVYGGNLFYPVEKAEEVLELYSRWARDLPDEVSSAVTFLNVPPIPDVPEPLRGKSVITVRSCYTGEDLAEKGEEMLGPWREFGEPIMDTFGVMPYEAMDMISMDPVDPIGAYGHSEMLLDLSPETRKTLVDLAGADSDTPLLLLEMRQLGGALSRPPADLNPMGRSDAAYIMNGIGATFTPEMAQAVQAYLAYVAETAKPHATGATYVNFMDLDGASPERVKAAYSPEDWKRLVELKDRRDPDNLFRYNRNVPPSSAEVASGTRSTSRAT
ncbi:MAG: FAD-binding oxidoreductase [Rubrobacter sp.]|nr:FAD-binding oxidoreductase [Rubrobacter sp.]MBA3953545.1 FAD-binding oxidoreductase [Rubrobacter sp.]MDQ3363388.1 FAD-binding oxidoreductase [Actinomycetota bacterium]